MVLVLALVLALALVLVLVLRAQRAWLKQGLRLLSGILLRQRGPGAWPTARNAALAQRPREIASRGPPSRKPKDGTPSAAQEPGV